MQEMFKFEVKVRPRKLVVYDGYAMLLCLEEEMGVASLAVPLPHKRIEQFKQSVGVGRLISFEGTVTVVPTIWGQEGAPFRFVQIEYSRSGAVAVLQDKLRGGSRQVPLSENHARELEALVGAEVEVDIELIESEVSSNA